MNNLRRTLFHHWDWLIVVILMIIYTITLGTLTVLRHNSFASNYDLANMDQTIWNSLHGRIFSLSGPEETISRFSIHADLILILLAPLYLLWDNVRILLLAGSAALALGAVPAYLIAKTVLKNKIPAIAVVIAYLLNPGMQWTNMYDFHAVSLAIPLLLSAFYCAYTRKWKPYLIFVALALLTKEEISLFISMMGLVIFFLFGNKKYGLITFVVGALWFVSMVYIVIPHFSPTKEHWAFSWYKFSDDTGKNSYISIPKYIFKDLISKSTVDEYYVSLIKPFGYLPILAFPWLVLSLPEIVINVTSSHAQMRSIFFHYDSGITPSLVISTTFGLAYITSILKLIKPIAKYAKYGQLLAAGFLVIASIRVNYHYGPLPTTPSCWCLSYQVSDNDRRFEDILQTIPKQASITASGNVRPHLTHRQNAFTLPSKLETADYVAILTQERIVGDYGPIDIEFVETLSKSNNHKLLDNVGQFFLFKRIN